MSREETIKILSVLEAAFPAFYRGQSNSQREAAVTLWTMQFLQTDYRIVAAAVQKIISTKTEAYPPTIGAVNEAIQGLLSDEEMTPTEAWGLVRRAISNGIYGAKQEWNRLPKVIQKIITPTQIRNWACDPDFNEGVESSNFMRSFTIVQKQEKELQMLPENVRLMIADTLRMQDEKQRNNKLLKELSPELAMLRGD